MDDKLIEIQNRPALARPKAKRESAGFKKKRVETGIPNGIGLKKLEKALKRKSLVRFRREGHLDLTLQGIWASTSPMDIVMLLWREGFHPEDVTIELLFASVSDVARATVTMPRHEAQAAQRWAKNRWWRGLELYARVEDR